MEHGVCIWVDLFLVSTNGIADNQVKGERASEGIRHEATDSRALHCDVLQCESAAPSFLSYGGLVNLIFEALRPA